MNWFCYEVKQDPATKISHTSIQTHKNSMHKIELRYKREAIFIAKHFSSAKRVLDAMGPSRRHGSIKATASMMAGDEIYVSHIGKPLKLPQDCERVHRAVWVVTMATSAAIVEEALSSFKVDAHCISFFSTFLTRTEWNGSRSQIFISRVFSSVIFNFYLFSD